jgi:hypothetical protein
MSISLVFGVLMAIGIVALLAAVGLLTGGRQATPKRESLVREPAENRELARVNGTQPHPQEQTVVPVYPRGTSQRELRSGTISREQERQEDLQSRYEQTLQELMTLLQQEQRSPSPTISQEEQDEDDPYRATARPRRQIDDALPSVHPERSVIASEPVPEPAEVQAHYSLVPNDEQAREKLPGGLSIPVSITLDGKAELEHVPRMRIEVMIHLQQ